MSAMACGLLRSAAGRQRSWYACDGARRAQLGCFAPMLPLWRQPLCPELRQPGCRSHRTTSTVLAGVVAPSWLIALVPTVLLPGSLAAASDLRWVMESCAGIGSVSMGLPGLLSLGIFINPMLEAIPRIRHDRDVGKLPLLPYSAMATQGMVWCTYGLLLGNPAVWTPNFMAMVLGLYYCSVYARYCPRGADWLPYSYRHHVGGFVATALLCTGTFLAVPAASAAPVLGLTGNVMTLLMFGGPLAALRTVIRDKSTRAMPFGFTVAVNLNCNMWFFYAYFMLADPFIFVQDFIGLLLTTVQLACFARYGIHRQAEAGK